MHAVIDFAIHSSRMSTDKTWGGEKKDPRQNFYYLFKSKKLNHFYYPSQNSF